MFLKDWQVSVGYGRIESNQEHFYLHRAVYDGSIQKQ
jgi:hypothetical protein